MQTWNSISYLVCNVLFHEFDLKFWQDWCARVWILFECTQSVKCVNPTSLPKRLSILVSFLARSWPHLYKIASISGTSLIYHVTFQCEATMNVAALYTLYGLWHCQRVDSRRRIRLPFKESCSNIIWPLKVLSYFSIDEIFSRMIQSIVRSKNNRFRLIWFYKKNFP